MWMSSSSHPPPPPPSSSVFGANYYTATSDTIGNNATWIVVLTVFMIIIIIALLAILFMQRNGQINHDMISMPTFVHEYFEGGGGGGSGGDGGNGGNDENSSTSNTLLFFTATWCPHCKKVQKDWHELMESCKNNIYTTSTTHVRVKCVVVDPDKDDDATKSIMQKYKVKAFPTIILDATTGGPFATFDKKITADNLRQFMDENAASSSSSPSSPTPPATK